MKAVSLSENEFQWLRKKNEHSNEKWIAIRIYSQPEDAKELSRRHIAQFEDVLFSHFTDIQQPVEEDGKLYQPFNLANYNQIIAFVEQHNDCDTLYVHCHAGICRSAGVVVGLAHKYDWITAQHGPDGNTDVYPYPNVVGWFV